MIPRRFFHSLVRSTATDASCSGRCRAVMEARRDTRRAIVFVVAFTCALFGPASYDLAKEEARREQAKEESGPHGGPPDNNDGTLASKNN